MNDFLSFYKIWTPFSEHSPIITQIESIDDEKYSLQKDRWSNSNLVHSLTDFNFKDFLKSLFFPDKRTYRLFIFWITSKELRFSNPNLFQTQSSFNQLSLKGVAAMPTTYSFAQNLSSSIYSCHVLVYEFNQKEYEDEAYLVTETLSAKDHLIRAGLMTLLEEYGWE